MVKVNGIIIVEGSSSDYRESAFRRHVFDNIDKASEWLTKHGAGKYRVYDEHKPPFVVEAYNGLVEIIR